MRKTMAKVFCVVAVLALSRNVVADILEAARNGNLDGIKQAIASGEDKNKRTSTPVHVAGGFYSGDPDEGEQTPLIIAAVNGHADIVRYLLEIGADPNAIDFRGRTAMTHAIKRKNPDIIDLLAANRQALEFKDPKSGGTPVMSAVFEKNEAALKVLLRRKPDLDAKDKRGCAALHYAAQYGQQGACELLLNAGEKVDAIDDDGKTPLMMAAENGNSDIVKQLIQRGANKSLKSKEERTALQYAEGKSGLRGLKIERIDDNTIRIVDGFIYQRDLVLGSESAFRIKRVEGAVFQTEGVVPMGAESAVGVTWMFSEPGITFHNGDYLYTSLSNEASVKFTKEGAILTHFEVANPSEAGIEAVIALLRGRPLAGRNTEGPTVVSPSPKPSEPSSDAKENPTQGSGPALRVSIVGGTLLVIVLLYAIFRFRRKAKT